MKINLIDKAHSDVDNWVENLFTGYNEPYNVDSSLVPYCFEALIEDSRVGIAEGQMCNGWLKLTNLVIDPQYQGKGIGSKLMEKVEFHAKDHGCVGIFLTTISFQAPEFYKKHGFEEFARLEKIAGEYELIYMKKVL